MTRIMPARRLLHFSSDTTAGICPEALAAIAEANNGRAASYGRDEHTARAKALMRDVFETDCEVFLVSTGTIANALSLAAVCRNIQTIICHETSHIATTECNAPEFFSGGAKLIALPGANGKLDLAKVDYAAEYKLGFHTPRPGALSFAESTDRGTVYLPEEIKAMADLAHRHGMKVHMDGARFANAVAPGPGRKGASPADLTWRAGVDVMSFGGSKNGMMSSEAVVFFRRELAADFEYRWLQAGQVLSKMRFSSAQWAAMLSSGAWLRYGTHANRMTEKLAKGLRSIPGISFAHPPEANMVFAEFGPALAERVRAIGWNFHTFYGETSCRLTCAWDTTDEDIDVFLADVRAAAGK